MSKFTGHIYGFLSRFKYPITIVVGILMVGVFGENSLMKRFEYAYQIEDLKEEIQEYEANYQRATEQLKELKRNPDAIAKIARKRYFMKADDEDIFVLSDDEQPAGNTSENETTE